MKDSGIDDSDIPRLDKSFLKKATMAWPPAKKQLTIRLDEDALDWHAPINERLMARATRPVSTAFCAW
jgi:hypothetical protein